MTAISALGHAKFTSVRKDHFTWLSHILSTGGSIATVTNFGTFGLTWATPIPLPEQTLVLGMGAGRRRLPGKGNPDSDPGGRRCDRETSRR